MKRRTWRFAPKTFVFPCVLCGFKISSQLNCLAAFNRTLANARKRGCEKIICLGDLTGYGKQSVECVELAMKEVDVCLMGNHDSACCGKENPLELIFNRNYDVDVATRDLLDRRKNKS